jgi:hypothetical protein
LKEVIPGSKTDKAAKQRLNEFSGKQADDRRKNVEAEKMRRREMILGDFTGWFKSLVSGGPKFGCSSPSRGNREQRPDLVAKSRWRNQSAIVTKPENSILRRSEVRVQFNRDGYSNRQWMIIQGHVSRRRPVRGQEQPDS